MKHILLPLREAVPNISGFLTDTYYPDNDSVTVFWVHGYPDSSELIIDTTDSIEEEVEKPSEITLSAYPNPFNSAVLISLDCHSLENGNPDNVTIEIFNVNGRIVQPLTEACLQPHAVEVRGGAHGENPSTSSGNDNYEFIWQPDAALGSGVYLVRATIGGCERTARLVYLK